MILSDTKIKELLANKESGFEISGVNGVKIESASIDLTLGNSFAFPKPKDNIITMDEPVEYTEVKYASTDIIVLPPKKSALATTREKIKLPKNVGAIVTGRSSIGRLGLFIENAGWVDPAFEGEITLELFNSSDFPIKIDIGRRVAQLILVEIEGEVANPYNGKYQNQSGATPSKCYLDSEVPVKQNFDLEESEAPQE